jgi:hypothetical protein
MIHHLIIHSSGSWVNNESNRLADGWGHKLKMIEIAARFRRRVINDSKRRFRRTPAPSSLCKRVLKRSEPGS